MMPQSLALAVSCENDGFSWEGRYNGRRVYHHRICPATLENSTGSSSNSTSYLSVFQLSPALTPRLPVRLLSDSEGQLGLMAISWQWP